MITFIEHAEWNRAMFSSEDEDDDEGEGEEYVRYEERG